ncbi:MAG: hypothetical protein ACJAU2_000333 [Maribacter sp.]|jgi:hypothetical protein
MINATTLFSGLFLFSSFCASGQYDFQEGYVVTNSNDTL